MSVLRIFQVDETVLKTLLDELGIFFLPRKPVKNDPRPVVLDSRHVKISLTTRNAQNRPIMNEIQTRKVIHFLSQSFFTAAP